ncbi:MAG: phosphohydrolase, partial [Firmicutes bacterium]|nr:phosphohydrolase [Bacillota bacterium]
MFSRLADMASVLWENLKKAGREPRFKRAGAALFLFIALTLLTAFQFYPERVSLEVGQVAPRTIKAPRSVVFEDKARTDELRREAAGRVPKMYDVDPQVLETIQRDIGEIINTVVAVKKDQGRDEAGQVAALKGALPFVLPTSTAKSLLKLPEDRLKELNQALDRLIEEVMASPGVRQEDLPSAEKTLSDRIDLLRLDPAEELFARMIVKHTLRPNRFYNAERTEMLQREAMEAVPPVEVTVRTGEKIIGEGEVVTPEHIAKLKAAGLYHSRLPLGGVLGVFFVVLLLVSAVFYYLYRQHREIYLKPSNIFLISLVIIGVLLVAKITFAIDIRQWAGAMPHLGYAVPVAAAGMLLSILFDSQIALMAVMVTAIFAGMMTDNQLRFTLAGFLTGITGVYSVSHLSRRGDLVRASVYVSIAAIFASLAMGLTTETPLRVLLPVSVGLGLINGLLSSILTNGALPVLEHLFGMTSPVKLLELT